MMRSAHRKVVSSGLRTAMLLAAGVVCCSSVILAQAHRAVIVGTLSDVTQRVVSGAEIRVVQMDTNVERITTTNAQGRYEVPGLLAGTYRVKASHEGFKAAVVEDVLVTSGERVEINLSIEVGAVTESVEVTAERQLLDAVTGDVNVVMRQKEIDELPIGQGHAMFLLLLAPGAGVARSGAGMDFQPLQRSTQGIIRFNGSPSGTTEFTLEGTPNTQDLNGPAGGGASVLPSNEMVSEVRIQTATFDASVGHSGGTTVDMQLKSGSNDWHGTGFGFVRDPSWQANSWSANRTGNPRPDIFYRRWGGNIGGPILKDKTFFFYGFERWKSFSPNPPFVTSVPRPAHLAGDFSDLLALGADYQLYDPLSARAAANNRIQREPFPNNVIPQSRIDSLAKGFEPHWPEPNAPGTPDGTNNFVYDLSPDPRSMWTSVLRLDHNLSRSHHLFGRWVHSHTGIPFDSSFGRAELGLRGLTGDNRDFAVTDVWTISPTFVADFRAAVTRFLWDVTPIGLGLDYGPLGLSEISTLTNTELIGWPQIQMPGYGRSNLPFGRGAGSQQVQEIRTGAAHFTKISGSHSIKFGADVRWYIHNQAAQDKLRLRYFPRYTAGPFDNSEPPPHGGPLADFLLGRFADARLNQPAKPANLATYQAFYIHDDWKVNDQLSLNIGLRYEREGPATERFNQTVASFAFDSDNPIEEEVRSNYAQNPIPELPVSEFEVNGGILFAGIDGKPRTIYDANNMNFNPRFGLAYRLNRDTVIRAGYGIHFIPYGQRFKANEGGVPGFDTNTFSFSTPDGGLTFDRTPSNLFPAGLESPPGTEQGLKTNLGQRISAFPRNLPNAYNQRWTFSIQRRLGEAHKLELRYVGNRTVRMPIAQNLAALTNRFLSASPERDQPVIDNLTSLVPNPFFGVDGVSGALGSTNVIAKSRLLQPFPQFDTVTIPTSQGWTSYDALQIEFMRRTANGLTFQANYTWAKTMDGLSFLSPADPVPERVVSSGRAGDRTHIFRAMAMYELPFGKGRPFGANTGGVVSGLISGWQVQLIPIVQTGSAFVLGNVLFRGNDYSDIKVDNQTAERMFNTEVFERDPSKQLAFNRRAFPSGLSEVRSPTGFNWDISVIKDTTISERFVFQYRFEWYNAFNQHFVDGPSTNAVSSAFGTTTRGSVPRAIQMGLRVLF